MLLTNHLICQKSDYIFIQFTLQNGLPSNECYDVIQDSEGYIWVATDNGVVGIDGVVFTRYGLPEGLEDLVIFTLKEDQYGRIWEGGQRNESYTYDRKQTNLNPMLRMKS
ncbi:MAG: ligand-binding sensor domain-containing protein [Saprospiraceae bacterium]